MSLVSIPWQPTYVLTTDTLALLERAGEIAGHDIRVTDAWREYAAQKYLYDGWVKRLPGFNLASNPDDPNSQNNHLRAAAVDIANRADRAAMLAAGFTPDAVEWWHFNNPNWRNMPIIRTNTSAASNGATNLPTITDQELEMGAYIISSPTKGTAFVVDGVRVIGANSPAEYQAVVGATRLTVSDKQLDELLPKLNQKKGLPTLYRATDTGEGFILTDHLLAVSNATYGQLLELGATAIPITRDDVNAWSQSNDQ